MDKGFIVAKIKYIDRDVYHCVDLEGKMDMKTSIAMLSGLAQGYYVNGYVCGRGTKAYVRVASGIPVIERHRKYSPADYQSFIPQYLRLPSTQTNVARARKMAEMYVAKNHCNNYSVALAKNGRVSREDITQIGYKRAVKRLRPYYTGEKRLVIRKEDVAYWNENDERNDCIWDIVLDIWYVAYACTGRLKKMPRKCIYFLLESDDKENDWALCFSYTRDFMHYGLWDDFYFMLAYQKKGSISRDSLDDWKFVDRYISANNVFGVEPFYFLSKFYNTVGGVTLFRQWVEIKEKFKSN